MNEWSSVAVQKRGEEAPVRAEAAEAGARSASRAGARLPADEGGHGRARTELAQRPQPIQNQTLQSRQQIPGYLQIATVFFSFSYFQTLNSSILNLDYT